MAKDTKQKSDALKRYIVTAKTPNYNGIGAGGVQFAYGKAEVNEGWVLNWYRERGYKIEEIAASPTQEGEDGK